MGGLSASMYFFAVSLWMPTSLATPRIDNPLALRLLHSVPPCCLEWSGLPMSHGNGFADSDCTVCFDRVDPGVESCQGRLPAPAQSVEAAIWG